MRCMKGLNDIEWNVTEPLANAFIGDGGVPNYVWQSKVNGIRSGDKIALISESGDPILTAPITGGTSVRAILRSIHKGMQTPLPESLMGVIYCRIGRFGKPCRKMLVKLAETGALCPHHLVGDHCFFEGRLTLTPGRVWIYYAGS